MQKDPTKTFIGGLIIGAVIGALIAIFTSAVYINNLVLPLILK